MRRTRTKQRSRRALAITMGVILFALSTLACSGSRGLSVGGSIHRDSSGRWGHSLSVGIHSHGRR